MPSIDRQSYVDPSILDLEIENIFHERMFVGTRFDYEAPQSYLSMVLGRRAITVRRSGDDVRAFGNVCLHRNALIDPTGRGERPFRCRYHGWSYAADGTLAEAPLADNSCIAVRTLPAFPVKQSEDLYFLGLSGSEPDTSEVSNALAKAEIRVERPFHQSTLAHECNWKLLVENVLEGYHLSFVHGNTFRPAGFTSTGNYSWGGGKHSSWSELMPNPSRDKRRAMRKLSPGAGHHYRHAYIFPDLFLSNTNGLVGFLSHIVPTSVSTTDLKWILFELPTLTALPNAVRDQIKDEAVRFTEQALREDQVLVESCQAGLSRIGFQVQLQPCEGRIGHFHELYANRIQHG